MSTPATNGEPPATNGATGRELDLEAFCRLVNIEVEKFKDHWRRQQGKYPDQFPKQLRESDWWEHFQIHLM